ncbi:hypothetical protein F5144DRAFT_585612 [Chaetomium tenue]|uniref:Uncharacterized protein n=1 Tax=Chaetomium tenue TaxID=1854479 RepID=A0ACB7NUZ5_9PEZI|nr:hypothetical protein F5144DRAFT_585612 [Chaetomium globosum]
MSSYAPPKCSIDGSSSSSDGSSSSTYGVNSTGYGFNSTGYGFNSTGYSFNSSAEYASGPVVGGSPGPRPNHPGYDRARATQIRAIHGILAVIAMAALFPSGAILVRLIPGRGGFWIHSLMQMLSLAVLASAVAVGIYLVQLMRGQTGVDLMADPKLNFHFIVGIVVFVALIFQPAFGLLHHERFRRLRRRQYWTYIHLLNGRLFMAAGIVNGALGLWISGNWTLLRVGYLAAAGTMWGLWFLVGLWKEISIWRETGPPWVNYNNEGGLPF